MRFARFAVAALTLSACSEEGTTTVLYPPDMAFLWGVVIDDFGGCLEGVTVSVIAGQARGRSVVQATPCGMWDYGGGFLFKHLMPGEPMTIRASAPGYVPKDTTLVPTSGPQLATLITPSKERSR